MKVMIVVPKAPYGDEAKIGEFGVFDIRGDVVDCLLVVPDAELETIQLAYTECECEKLISTEHSPYILNKVDELTIQGVDDELVDIYDFCNLSELKKFVTPVALLENAYLTDRFRSDVMKALDLVREFVISDKYELIRNIFSNLMLKMQYAVANNTVTFENALAYLDTMILLAQDLIRLGYPLPSQVVEDLKAILTTHRSQWRAYFSTFLLHAIRDLKPNT